MLFKQMTVLVVPDAGVAWQRLTDLGGSTIALATSSLDGLAGGYARSRPDLVALDAAKCTRCASEVINDIRAIDADAKVAVFARDFEPFEANACLRGGASAYLTYGVSDEELLSALVKAAAGEAHVEHACALRLISHNMDVQALLSALSTREQEALRLLGTGHSLKELAEHFSIQPKNAWFLWAQLRKKLAVKTFDDLEKYAQAIAPNGYRSARGTML
ncbi:MAG: hypothetical protein QM780_13280 [Hyphomicrobium sp.]|uniref:hypothetical protein n=1 Tax=Hyphomicrobium sp. TaxID=82 RepID=UPI0039E33624